MVQPSSSAALPSAAITTPPTHPAVVETVSGVSRAWCQEQEQRAGPKSVLASGAKKRRSMQPYTAFCRAERPLLPPFLSNSERERTLGERWRASNAEKAAKWESSAPARASTPAPTAYSAPGSPSPSRRPIQVQRPVHPVTPDCRVAFSEQQTPAQLADRWAGLWRANEAKTAAAGDSLTLLAPAPALAKPSGSPAPTAPAAPTAPSATPAPAAPSAPLPPAAAQPDAPTESRTLPYQADSRGMSERSCIRPTPTFTPAAPPAELLVLPNGNTIPCFPRLYLTTRSAPAPAPAPFFPCLYLAPAGPAAAATSTKEVPAPERARLESFLDELLREELDELTSEEAMEALLG